MGLAPSEKDPPPACKRQFRDTTSAHSIRYRFLPSSSMLRTRHSESSTLLSSGGGRTRQEPKQCKEGVAWHEEGSEHGCCTDKCLGSAYAMDVRVVSPLKPPCSTSGPLFNPGTGRIRKTIHVSPAVGAEIRVLNPQFMPRPSNFRPVIRSWQVGQPLVHRIPSNN